MNVAEALTVPLAFRWLADDEPNVRQVAGLARAWVDAHPDDVFHVAKALLLTDQRDAAMDLLHWRGQYRTAFEIFEAQQRYADALKVAAEAAHEPARPGPAAPPSGWTRRSSSAQARPGCWPSSANRKRPATPRMPSPRRRRRCGPPAASSGRPPPPPRARGRSG